MTNSTDPTLHAAGRAGVVLAPPTPPAGAATTGPAGSPGVEGSTAPDSTAPGDGRVPWRPVAVFTALALGLGWLAALPLHLGGGLADPALLVWAAVMMTTPAIAGIVVTLRSCPPGTRQRVLGVRGGLPWRRATAVAVLAAAAAVALSTATLLLAAAFGMADLRTGPDTASSLLLVPVLTVVIGLTAVGEELGWRGYLHTALRPLGVLRSQLVSGVLWGVWHAPLLLLGYNYATTSPVSIALMVVSTVLIGTLLAWLREVTGTVWAGALAHGAMNSATSFVVAAFVAPEQQTPWITVLGWPGWIALAAAITVVALAGGFRPWRARR